jgi:hypothetical protein
MTDKKLIVDLAKGTQTYVDLTPEEIEQRAVDAQAAAIEKAERDAQQMLLRLMQNYQHKQSYRPSV